MNNLEREIPKYKKKKESSVSKAKTKSNHKHDYSEMCLIEWYIKNAISNKKMYSYCIAYYCKKCGKIENYKYVKIEELSNYKHLKMIKIDCPIWKLTHIPIGEENG